MINAKGVRLGNWLLATDGKISKVTMEAMKYLSDYDSINQADGIWISPDMLEQCGFTLLRDETDKHGNRMLTYRLRAVRLFFRIYIKDEWKVPKLERVTCGCDTNLKHIQYIHQLQNLYHGYYGQELLIEDLK